MMTARKTLSIVAILFFTSAGWADDWPTYRHDNRRSGAAPEKLRLPMEQIWRYDSPSPPTPAWSGPAKWNAYAGIKGLHNMRDFDSAYHVTAVGGRVFFGSSSEDAAYCLDAATGKVKWTAHADAPVRLPPTVAGDKAYFGSDDGLAYCVKVSDGSIVWKYRAAPGSRVVPANGKLISLQPVRTGVLVADGKAYFAASLFPWRQSQLCAVDAETGKDSGAGLFKTLDTGYTMQGAMLASDDKLFVQQGRVGAVAFSRKNGKFAYPMTAGGEGGTRAVLTKDGQLISGPGSRTGAMTIRDSKTQKRIGALGGALRTALSGGICYICKPGELSAFRIAEYAKLAKRNVELRDRQRKLGVMLKVLSVSPKDDKKAQQRRASEESIKKELKTIAQELRRIKQASGAWSVWKVKSPETYELIIAGDTIFLGGDGEVVARSAKDGKQLWKGRVDGKARGLAAANGRLYVSTDKGKIHCFAPTKTKRENDGKAN